MQYLKPNLIWVVALIFAFLGLQTYLWAWPFSYIASDAGVALGLVGIGSTFEALAVVLAYYGFKEYFAIRGRSTSNNNARDPQTPPARPASGFGPYR